MRTFHDQLNRKIELQFPPLRIISLVPSQTELLVDLGLNEQILGITKFCVHPENLRKEKEVVGGTKQVHMDRLKALNPDLILCNKEENTEEMVLELEKLFPVHVSDVKTIDEAVELIRQYGEIFEVRERASEIAETILNLQEEFQQSLKDTKWIKVAYFIWKNPWMVVGKDTFIDHLLQLNKLENVFSAEKSRYPEIMLEQLEERNVALVLLSTEPFPFNQSHKEQLDIGVTKPGILIVDGEYFSWYGSRLIAAYGYFRELQKEIYELVS